MSQYAQHNRGSLDVLRSMSKIFSIHCMYSCCCSVSRMVNFLNWALLDWIVRIEVAIASVEISNVSPCNCLFLWIGTICRTDWNRLMSLGRALSSWPFGSVLTFLPCPCCLGSPRRFAKPSIELLNFPSNLLHIELPRPCGVPHVVCTPSIGLVPLTLFAAPSLLHLQWGISAAALVMLANQALHGLSASSLAASALHCGL